VTLPLPAVIALDAAAWCTIQVMSGYLVHRLPDERLDADHWLLRERSFEGGGRLYRTTLAVPRWKRLLPEAGALFSGGFDKRALPSWDTAQLVRYWREARRAELGHWLAMAPLPLFALWNPPRLWPAMAVYAVAVNAPCIASQRYNLLRLSRVLAARANGSRWSSRARHLSSFGTTGRSIP
jgi:glycosyl-4,4'-diaponeurosporenoate acyltransferase